MNWYKKSQQSYQSRHDNYLLRHNPEDCVWVFDQHQILSVDCPKKEGDRVTHNRSFGPEGRNFMYKGRYNPKSGIVEIIDHKNFLATQEQFWKNSLDNALYDKFTNITKINYN